MSNLKNTKQMSILSNIFADKGVLQSLKVRFDGTNYNAYATFSLYGYENKCVLKINKKSKMVDKTCDCRWFQDHGTCHHVNLLAEDIRENGIQGIQDQTDAKYQKLEEYIVQYEQKIRIKKLNTYALQNRQLLELLKQKYETSLKQELEDVSYEITPIIKDNNLSFKVGQDKKYIIKDMFEFLSHINRHDHYSYGKNLAFVHDENAFSESSKQLILFMRKYINTNYLSSNRRSFRLSGKLLDECFDLCVGHDEYDMEFEVFDRLSGKIHVKEEGDFYCVTLDEPQFLTIGEKHLYDIDEQYMFRYVLDETGITAVFINQLYDGEMIISKQDYPSFYQYVLMTAMNYINIELPKTQEHERCEKIELYGDIEDDNRISLYLYYYNDNHHRYYGFEANHILSYEQQLIEAYMRSYAHQMDEISHKMYMNIEQESTLDFISEGLPFLSSYCEIYVSEALKSLGKVKHYPIHVGIRFRNQLLELNISSDDIPKEELMQVLQAYRKKKKFHRLKNGNLLSLQSQDLLELNELMDEYHMDMKDLKKGKMQLDPYRMFQLNDRCDHEAQLLYEREASFTKQLDAFYNQKPVQLSKHYQTILRDYQKEGVKWLSTLRNYHFNGILADDMGLGKTIQVIAYLECNRNEKASLVVCPASLIYNWEDEVHKFSEQLRVACISGNAQERKAVLNHRDAYDLLITSYDYLRRDIENYADLSFDTVILDEAQNIKNQMTKNAMSVKQLSASHRIALSGTPIENSLAELWSIFDFLMPGYLFSYHYFQKAYEKEIVKNQNKERQLALKRMVAPFILRRNKKDVLHELPDKIEIKRMITFSDEEKKLYMAHVMQASKELSKMDNVSNNKIQVLALLTKCRQLCCEPRLLYDNVQAISSKMLDCLELIEELHANQRKVLLFSAFTSILDLLAEELKRKQISFYQLSGKTKKEDRKIMVENFQEDNTAVFLISLKAGGTGLNLTAAEAVIHFDPWWNQSAQNQASDRAYRIGQTKNVQVFKLIMKDSIEEKIVTMQDHKKELADAFVEHNESSISTMSKEEIMALFQMD